MHHISEQHAADRSTRRRHAIYGESVRDVRANTLRRAAQILRGEEPLALRLGATPLRLARWTGALAGPPVDIALERPHRHCGPHNEQAEGQRTLHARST